MGSYDEAAKFLGYIVASAAEAVSLDGRSDPVTLPDRQYVTAGQAVYDCEQVAVTMIQSTAGLPLQTTPGAGSINACPMPENLTLEVAIVRCSPTVGDNGAPPSVSKLNNHARTQARDADVLMAAVQKRVSERFGTVGVTISFPPPSGGMSATLARVQVAISL